MRDLDTLGRLARNAPPALEWHNSGPTGPGPNRSILEDDIEIQSQQDPSVCDRCPTCQSVCEDSVRIVSFRFAAIRSAFLLSDGLASLAKKHWERDVARVRGRRDQDRAWDMTIWRQEIVTIRVSGSLFDLRAFDLQQLCRISRLFPSPGRTVADGTEGRVFESNAFAVGARSWDASGREAWGRAGTTG